ncbi:MAG: Gfo/Idh/MocA family oxidoreductase [Sedimentisphaerales bacterium]|nr:Gfo/Idh/MocA family oxidoreductase [Sedimentisphaerales bacterium]
MRRPAQDQRVTRRQFLGASTALAAFTIVPRHVLAHSGRPAPSEKLNVGCVGVGGMQGANDVGSVSSENIYALCDIDENFLNTTAKKYPAAKKYRDFREMLDKEHKNLDGITITIPDHMHASVALRAMQRGLGVYCQKPLTQSVWEARLLTNAARKYKVPTQMGNQGYSSTATRIACEIIWEGRLGDIKEVHSLSGGGFARGITQWPPVEPVPETLDWNLWTGRAAEHTYSSKIHPSNWRGFLEYGTQMIGDWGIHMLGPANWALQLAGPASVECTAVEGVNPVTYPHYACKFEFPRRPNKYVPSGQMPPLTLYWYEGSMTRNFKPPEGLTGEDVKRFNEIFVGTKGFMGTDGRGESVRLTPESKMKDFKKPKEVIERSPGHFQDWIRACKTGKEACSNFTFAGPYTEWMLLGAISWRFPNQKLLWDAKNLRFTNNDKANEFVKPKFRKGWELEEITA